MSRVLLVNMPFSNLRWPNIGPSLLKGALGRRGIGCDIVYLNFDFAERVGWDDYYWIAEQFGFVLGGERLFAKQYFGGVVAGLRPSHATDRRSPEARETFGQALRRGQETRAELGRETRAEPGRETRAKLGWRGQETRAELGETRAERLRGDVEYWREVLLRSDAGLGEEDRRNYERIGEEVGAFLEHCRGAVDWAEYAVVGFAASFQQTMPSMCLARWLKGVRPETVTVLGGAACEGPMGEELLRQFPEIDYVFLGEADVTFPALVDDVLAGRGVRPLPGVAGRGWAAAPLPATCEGLPTTPDAAQFLLHSMDDLPYPDFDDYFARLRRSPLAGQFEPILFFEASRGCWWGQKHHCAFCGLNGSRLAYRSKSPQRAIDELRYLVDRHGVHKVSTADNILDHRYFQTLLPMLVRSDLDLGFVFEMKTNLTRQQADLLLEAGLGGVQLGIETFSTPLLRRIGKGATAVHNLQALKWFSEAGVEVKWNFLYGFPGEDPAEYPKLAELLPLLFHMPPPLGAGRVRVDRFAPYFEDPAAHGVASVRVNRAFGYVYPFAEDVLSRLAYYFEYDYADGRTIDYTAPVVEAIGTWEQLAGTVTLRWWDRPDGVLILTDTRPCATSFQHRLTGPARQIYLFCDTARPWAKIAEQQGQDEAAARRIVDQLVRDRLMVYVDDRYLSLALRAPEGAGVRG